VRITGMKRARMIVRGPFFSKYAFARSTFLLWNKRDSGRRKIAGPARRPMT